MGSCCTKYYVHKKEGTIPYISGLENIDKDNEYFLYPSYMLDIDLLKEKEKENKEINS